MGLFAKLNPFRTQARTSPATSRRDVRVRARYDVAQTTDDNRRIWGAADALSADAENRPMVRRPLRNRSRYEVANNSYAKGIVLTLANYVVGTGPRLQVLTDDPALNTAIEDAFGRLAAEICLAEKLRTTHMARVVSGEVFGVMTTNRGLQSPVKLDWKVVESDQISDPGFENAGDTHWADGVRFDDDGNPVSYRLLKQHPGSLGFAYLPWDYEDIPASAVLPYLRADRPGQRRGVPELTPALRLFNDLRRYSSAVVRAAETAADHVAVLETESPTDDAPSINPYDLVELEKGMATVLPYGSKLGQMKAEQPTNTYDSFVWCLLREIARCLNIPLTIAALDSSRSNLSAAYLDHQTFAMAVVTDRAMLERLLDRFLAAFLEEASLVPGLLPGETPELLPHQWFWPSIGQHADPGKVADAQASRLASGTSTIPREYAAVGLDWEKEQASGAKAFGITVAEYQKLIRDKTFSAGGQPGTGDGTGDEGEGGDGDDESLAAQLAKEQADAYGVAVRAGVVTPQSADEAAFRGKLSLPPMGPDAVAAWKKDKGTRRPITITPAPGDPAAAPGFPSPAPDSGESAPGDE